MLIFLLIGAHSLGRARRANSGYIGKWVANELALDNSFYKDMIEIDSWIQVK